MQTIDAKQLGLRESNLLLTGCIGPRPIALVSTVSATGINNLAPFSFFNAFSAAPPIVAFSPARSGRDGRLKDTYNNLMATKECVIQVVTHAIVEQVNLASTEYPPEVDEFVKSGLTPIAAERVKAMRVQESPVQMECRLQQMIPLGDGKGAGNLAICEVLLFHLADGVLVDGKIDPDRLDLVGRLGADLYARASGAAILSVPKPSHNNSIGYDRLPDFMKQSDFYSANNLGRFALVEKIPNIVDVDLWMQGMTAEKLPPTKSFDAQQDFRALAATALNKMKSDKKTAIHLLERSAKIAVEKNELHFAWCAALYAGQLASD